jgi:hypothetical protein
VNALFERAALHPFNFLDVLFCLRVTRRGAVE